MYNGKIVSLRVFERLGSKGRKMPSIRFVDHAGIIGDYRYGEKEMQISIMTKSTESWMSDKKGLCFQRSKANIVIDGIEEELLEVGNFLKIGNAVLEITGFEQRCFSECERYVKHLECKLMKGCCYTRVIHDGKVRKGDVITIIEAGEQAKQEEKNWLNESSALVVGVGSIGYAAARALAASGVGILGIVDSSIVTEEDRESLPDLTQEDIGKNKAEVMRKHLINQYPHCDVEAWNESITEENGDRILPGYGIVLLATNMAATRDAIRKIAATYEIPLVDDKKVAELIGRAEAEYAIEVLCQQRQKLSATNNDTFE